jgi:transposase-like protein
MATPRKKNPQPGGRPTKYKSSMCDVAIECGRQGMTLAGIAAELDVSRDTLYRWRDEHPEFSDAIKKARDLAMSWWENTLRRQATMPNGGSTAAAVWAMKNQFREDYADRHELSGPDGGPVEVSQIQLVAPDDD